MSLVFTSCNANGRYLGQDGNFVLNMSPSIYSMLLWNYSGHPEERHLQKSENRGHAWEFFFRREIYLSFCPCLVNT